MGKENVGTGSAPDAAQACGEGRDSRSSDAAYVPACVCYAFAGRGCGYPIYTENAGALIHRDDADLYLCGCGEAKGNPQAEASAQ